MAEDPECIRTRHTQVLHAGYKDVKTPTLACNDLLRLSPCKGDFSQ